MQALNEGSLLQGGKYRILQVIGHGGFGITYLGVHDLLGTKVAIKEFYIEDFSVRDASSATISVATEGGREQVCRFKEKFLKEARNIAKLRHPNIVRISDVFEENGTAYYVMDYCGGGSLAAAVKKSGPLSEERATRYILKVADALDYIHKNKMTHLDIKPANIMLDANDEPVVIDFGLSKQYDAESGNQTSTTPVGISEGYAPIEQYRQGGVGEFSPETDLYALGATFFKLLTGKTPPVASDVFEDGVPVNELKAHGVSQAAIDVICKAMEGSRKNRMKQAKAFIEGLQQKPRLEEDEDATIMIGQARPVQTQAASLEEEENEEATLLRVKGEVEKKVGQVERVEKFEGVEKKVEKVKSVEEVEPKSEKVGKVVQNPVETTPETAPKKGGNKEMLIGIAALAIVGLGIGLFYATSTSDKNQNAQQKTAEPMTEAVEAENDAVESAEEVNEYFNNDVLHIKDAAYRMVKVEAGSFVMGATPEMKDAWDDEKITHKVTLTQDFYIGATEVTQTLWQAVMGNNPSRYKGDNRPVESVSWNDCQTFIKELNALTGLTFRLPTEAEWEFAARGGNQSQRYQFSGNNKASEVAWYDGNSGGQTHDVASKQPNELGLYDMSGNVWEWCSDWYAGYKRADQTDPQGPNAGDGRVSRGGSWDIVSGYCRVSYRGNYSAGMRGYNLGVRLVLNK